MQHTIEQQAIIDCDLAPGNILKVMAFAGTGKTTTLVSYTRKRPDMRFLYIAFNKSVQEEAARKFPPNVTARTTHALAFRTKGYPHKDRLVPGYRAGQVRKALDLDRVEDARFAMETLNRYLISADPKVAPRHVPPAARAFYRKKGLDLPDLVDLANRLGRLMCTAGDETIGMLHDGYLKLFQLSNPVLDYDCILLDEAQDINPVTAAFVLAQTRPGPDSGRRRQLPSLIIVGDGHQQIYSFRGATDTLKHLDATQTRYLTQSFRFDNNIARVANMVLTAFKKEERSIRGTPVNRDRKPPWDPKGHTVIARTNARLFDRAIRLTCSVGFVGGVGGYRLDLLKEVFRLYDEDPARIRDPYIKGFSSFSDLKSYARTVEDLELLSVCAMVEKHGRAIPGHVDRIKSRAVDADRADVVLTTAHKAKGLEWNNVLILDDFTDLAKDGAVVDPAGVDPDEFNLIYVAMTRAMIHLRFHRDSSIPEFIRLVQKQKR